MTKTGRTVQLGRHGSEQPRRRATELEVEIEIPASPKRVWEVLTDFDSYAEWHPYETIAGSATKFGRLRIVSRKLNGEAVQSRTVGVIMQYQEMAVLEIASGSPLFWGAWRWYHLQASPKGTLLRHGTKFTGFLARKAFITTHKIGRLQPYLDAVSDAISRRAVSRNWRRTAGGNRHSRRASQAKRRHDE